MQCEVPLIDQSVLANKASDILQTRLKLSQISATTANNGARIDTAGLDPYISYSLNTLELPLVPVPKLNSVYPQSVYNVADLGQIQVFGEHFNEHSVCVFDTMTGPVYGRVLTAPPLRVVNQGLILCRSKQALKGKRGGQSITVGVSNDNGRTVSNTLEISLRAHLPRVLALTEPGVIFADS